MTEKLKILNKTLSEVINSIEEEEKINQEKKDNSLLLLKKEIEKINNYDNHDFNASYSKLTITSIFNLTLLVLEKQNKIIENLQKQFTI